MGNPYTPILGCAYAPKMEDAFKTKNPAVHCQKGGVPGVPRGNALARFLGSFFAAWQRMNIKSNPRSAQLDKVEVGCMRVKRRSHIRFSKTSSLERRTTCYMIS